MKILIVSDTHGNINLFKKVLSEEKPGILFHLGDNYEDSERASFSKYCKTLYRVPGIYNPGYMDQSLAHIESFEFSGFPIKLIHNINEIDFSEVAHQIIFYGHTHVHNVQEFRTNILVNPGHLKAPEDRNQPASYLIMLAAKEELNIHMYIVGKGLVKTYKIRKLKDNKLELII
jgi:putative phosphoesterase